MKRRSLYLFAAALVLFSCGKTEGQEEKGGDNPGKEEPVVTEKPYLTVDGELSLAASGGDVEFKISTNQESWEFELVGNDISWIEGNKKDAETLVLTVRKNEVEEKRSAVLKVYAPSLSNPLAGQEYYLTQEEGVIEYPDEVLSENGTANCYVITHRGKFFFDATVRGNGKTVNGLDAPAAIYPSGAVLLWQTSKEMILSVSCKEGQIEFEASKRPGNALIAATDEEGNILWSWHIWHPEEEIIGLKADTGDEVMNMNLGALNNSDRSLGSYGLLYQWGRKDPFPGSPIMSGGSVITENVPVYDMGGNKVKINASSRFDLKSNTLAFSIANPTTCISNNAQASSKDWLVPEESNKALWGNPEGYNRTGGKYTNVGSKTYYDPCPAGWRVPPIRTFQSFTTSGGYAWVFEDFNVVDINGDGTVDLGDFNTGWHIYLDKGKGVESYFPAATRYDGGYAMFMGSMVGLWGNYWFNCPGSEADDSMIKYGAVALSFSTKDYNKNDLLTMSPLSTGARADAYSVRCIKE